MDVAGKNDDTSGRDEDTRKHREDTAERMKEEDIVCSDLDLEEQIVYCGEQG